VNKTETKSRFLFKIINKPEVNNCFSIISLGDIWKKNKNYRFLCNLIDKTASTAISKIA
jgi:hypothetical protein